MVVVEAVVAEVVVEVNIGVIIVAVVRVAVINISVYAQKHVLKTLLLISEETLRLTYAA